MSVTADEAACFLNSCEEQRSMKIKYFVTIINIQGIIIQLRMNVIIVITSALVSASTSSAYTIIVLLLVSIVHRM